ncbi:MAG: agmatine deiminase [Ruminococcus sp.]|nr:agmatine deiminase [Ruminococcus sp.]
MKLRSIPSDDGFCMPAEFSPHRATVIIFPERPGSWGYGAEPAQAVFAEIIRHIAEEERVYVIVSDKTEKKAEALFGGYDNVILLNIPTDDSWARDVAPTFVTDGRDVRGIDWQFNAWGGSYDGLYAHWENDNALAEKFCGLAGYECYDAQHFVLEGGSVHSDGEGTLMVTESCLLSRGRNPQLTKEQIERNLCSYLGGKKVLWLPRGIYNDETNEHVDNVCAFIRPGEVVLAWTDDENDPQYPLSKADLDYLESVTDAKGRKIKVHKLPIPDVPVTITEHDLAGYTFEEGEDEREVGERLAASYVNFYFTNGSILLPQFGGVNKASDERAVRIMQELCPDRRIIPIDAREIIIGGGNIHCITQQIPAAGRNASRSDE